jgi:cold shock CspA family protein
MTGTITRLVDSRQIGSISAEDGHEYAFRAGSLRGVEFSQLSLGTAVSFTPGRRSNERQAESVQLIR